MKKNKKKHSRLVLTFAFLAVFIVHPLAFAQDSLTPGNFRIKDIKSSGDACRPGTVAVNISEDKEAFTVSFSDFVAEKGPDAATSNRRVCRLVFDTEQDANWEYAVMSMTMRGFAQLDSKVNARQEIQFGTKGVERDDVFELNGPYEDNYIHAEAVPLSSLRWSGCKAKASDRVRDFAVKATALVKGGGRNSRGLLTVDTIDGQLEQVYEIVWRRCGDKGPRFVASCQLTGDNGKTLLVKGMGRSSEMAMQKANIRINQRCANVKDRFGVCESSRAQCSVTSF